MEGCSTFQWGGVFVFQIGGFIFKWGVHPMAGIGFDGGGGEKNLRMWGGTLTMANPAEGE